MIMAIGKEYFHAKIQGGKFQFGKYFKGLLKEFCLSYEGKRIWITIVAGNPRSIAQNAFLHGPLIDAFVRATGDTDRDKWKGRLREMFLRVPDGKGGTYTQGTSELTVGEFMKFINDCIQVLMDQHHGHLEEQEHKEYEGTLGKNDVDYYKDEKNQAKMFDRKTGEVLQENIPW